MRAGKYILVMMLMAAIVGCGETITDPVVEEAIKNRYNSFVKINKADLVRVIVLHLEHTKITNDGLKDVAKLQNLRHLYLNDTKITDKGLRELAKLDL